MRMYKNTAKKGKELTIVYLNVGGMNLAPVLGNLFEKTDGISINFITFDSEDTIRDPKEFREMQKAARSSDLFMINMHGDVSGYKKFDPLKACILENSINTFLLCNIEESVIDNRPLFKGTDEEFLMIRRYIQLGGEENRKGLVLWLLKNIGGAEIDVPEPVRSRAQGLYHPDFPLDVKPEDYYPTLDPEKPTVGIMFPHGAWLNKKLEPYNILIREVEKLGANTIPVFYIPAPSDITGSTGAIKLVEQYFKKDGKAIVGSIITPNAFSQVALSDPGDGSGNRFNFYQDLDVTALQAIPIFRSQQAWKDDEIGMEGGELAICVALPELDGLLTTVPFLFNEKDEDGRDYHTWRQDRIERIAGMAVKWAAICKVPIKDRKVSILVNGSGAGLGSAGGLDSFESIRNMLEVMADAGYTLDHVPQSGQEIIDEMNSSLTNDLEWKTDKDIEEQAMELMSVDRYKKWLDELHEVPRGRMCRNWGDPPGSVMSYNGRFIIPGVVNGNVYLGMEPIRGKHEKAEELIHDPHIVMPHQYLAYYRWIAQGFKTDIHVHVGTHGSLEWLPGKGNGLSEECFPDIMMQHIPNLYVYVIDDPSEGIVAKRRKNSVLVDHMMPSLTRAGTYDKLMELEANIHDYLFCRSTFQKDKLPGIAETVYGLIKEMSMWKELKIEEDAPIEEVMERIETIYDYVSDLKDGLITDGLHILGKVPEGRHMQEMVYCLTRLRNGGMPSLRISVAESMGFDLDELMDNFSSINSVTGEVNGGIVNRVDDKTQELLFAMQEHEYRIDECLALAKEFCPENNENVLRVTEFICNSVHPSILGMVEELTNGLNGLGGGFVPPGPSGSPTRGNAHLLPTGKNYYSLDPETVPTQSSWKAGMKMADQMIERYIEDEGTYPENVGIVVWSVDTMKTGGDDVAYILYLMGVRPIWGSTGGKINGLEVISQEELKRPRIDVTVRISSLFRDTFPNLFQLIDEAVELVADLDEGDEKNFIRKHLQKDIAEMIKNGMSADDARSNAMIRVFGEPPGTHGAGVDILIESKKWNNIDDLAQIYITCGCSAYGRKWRGETKPELFRHRLNQLDVAVKNQVDREFDLIDTDDGYAYFGGINAVVRSSGKKKPLNVIGDSSDPDRLKVRDLEGEMAYIMRTRLLNPKWIEGLKDHGFVGANLIAVNVNHALGWDATSDVIEDWMYESMTEHFLFDEDNRKWIEESNPLALRGILEDMLEAISRGLWETTEEMEQRLKELYLETEGVLEEVNGKRGDAA
ncbi:MAG: cobaltochelatase subunit CobN [Candidatus Methanoplasma sp.]|jgi:cobaltochelatase CobN|nr:cobaltochelatase subunit CobN [Candidatus Methanoplasma sp.]